VETVVGDLRDPDALKRAVVGIDAVVHVAATLRDGADEATTTAVNTDATVELARAALAAGAARFVFTSTNLVYGDGHPRPQRETDEPRPSNWPSPYPASKLAAERALAALVPPPSGLDLRILRLAFVYGDGDPHLTEGLDRWAHAWHPAKRMHTVHHADVAQAVIRALRVDGIAGRTYNVADDAGLSAADMLALHGRDLPADAITRTLDDPFQGIVDTTLIRTTLGFRPIHPTARAAHAANAL
jgi:nucleoside-diphosphate-sugar epimerase